MRAFVFVCVIFYLSIISFAAIALTAVAFASVFVCSPPSTVYFVQGNDCLLAFAAVMREFNIFEIQIQLFSHYDTFIPLVQRTHTHIRTGINIQMLRAHNFKVFYLHSHAVMCSIFLFYCNICTK